VVGVNREQAAGKEESAAYQIFTEPWDYSAEKGIRSYLSICVSLLLSFRLILQEAFGDESNTEQASTGQGEASSVPDVRESFRRDKLEDSLTHL
jgi:hypothetical protein